MVWKKLYYKQEAESVAVYSRVKQKSKTTRKEAVENKYEIVLIGGETPPLLVENDKERERKSNEKSASMKD